MTLSKPPALASWMLEHLTLSTDKDALAGDLLEEFGHRRSAEWYWRQVFMAILVGFSRELGHQWKAAVFALAWTATSAIALRLLYQNTQFHSIFRWALSYDWPVSGILTTSLGLCPQILLWWLGLALYLLLMRKFSARRFARGVLISFFCMLLAFGWYLSVWGTVIQMAMRAMPPLAIDFVTWTPSALALLLCLCVTLPGRAIRRAPRVYVAS